MVTGPSVLITLTTLLVFLIPSGTGEKFILCSGLIVAITMLLVALEGFLPPELGTAPVIAAYLCFNFFLLVTVIIVSILVLNAHNRDTKQNKVPGWLRWIFLGRLRRLMCVSAEPYTSVPTDITTEDAFSTNNEL